MGGWAGNASLALGQIGDLTDQIASSPPPVAVTLCGGTRRWNARGRGDSFGVCLFNASTVGLAIFFRKSPGSLLVWWKRPRVCAELFTTTADFKTTRQGWEGGSALEIGWEINRKAQGSPDRPGS